MCSVIIISTVYYLNKVTPFGEHSLLTIDFFHQYGPMLAELWDRVINGQSLIYSFRMGLGLPIFRNFFNYLSSPFNIIMFFFNRNSILTSYSFIIGLKAVASCITTSIFLNKKFGKNYLFISLSLLYGFSAYFVAYYWNIMWLDGMVLIPLITLGIENLITKEKTLLYIISLAIMLFANYFIGYMLCIYSIIYFVFYLILNTDKFEFKVVVKKCLLFGISSLLAGCLCAIFLIPLYDALKTTSSIGGKMPLSQYYAFTIKDFIFNHLSGVGSTVLKNSKTLAPNISIGILPIALLLGFKREAI